MHDKKWVAIGHQKDLLVFKVVFTAVGVESLKAGKTSSLSKMFQHVGGVLYMLIRLMTGGQFAVGDDE